MDDVHYTNLLSFILNYLNMYFLWHYYGYSDFYLMNDNEFFQNVSLESFSMILTMI